MATTKAALQARVAPLERMNHLLLLYLHDSQNGLKPHATASEAAGDASEVVEGDLYRPSAADGGYVILRHQIPAQAAQVEVAGLEDLSAKLADTFTESTLPLRIVLERLTRARNAALQGGA